MSFELMPPFADHLHQPPRPRRTKMSSTIEIRPSRPDDAVALHDLAAVDSAAPLSGDILVAIVDDDHVAAVSLEDGRVIADPFRRTAATVEMLKVRATGHGDRGRTRRL